MRFIIRKFYFSISVIAAFGVLSAANGARAIPLDPALTATGSITFDTSSFANLDVTQTGSMTVKEGGSDTSTDFDGSTVTVGSNPLLGTFIDQGDGLGMVVDIDTTGATPKAEFLLGIDLIIDVLNTSSTDTIKVTITVVFSNAVDSDGDDAFAGSEFFLIEVPGDEFFLTEVISDTVGGNELRGSGIIGGGGPVSGFGGLVSDSGSEGFDFILGPGDSLSLDGDYTADGGIFASGFAKVNFSAFVSISDMNLTNPPGGPPNEVPEPGSLLLLATGLMGLGLTRRRRKRA